MCRDIFRVEARALGLFFFDQMINTFDPDALIVGAGVVVILFTKSLLTVAHNTPECRNSSLVWLPTDGGCCSATSKVTIIYILTLNRNDCIRKSARERG